MIYSSAFMFVSGLHIGNLKFGSTYRFYLVSRYRLKLLLLDLHLKSKTLSMLKGRCTPELSWGLWNPGLMMRSNNPSEPKGTRQTWYYMGNSRWNGSFSSISRVPLVLKTNIHINSAMYPLSMQWYRFGNIKPYFWVAVVTTRWMR